MNDISCNSDAKMILRSDLYIFVQVCGWGIIPPAYPTEIITFSHRLGVYRHLQGFLELFGITNA